MNPKNWRRAAAVGGTFVLVIWLLTLALWVKRLHVAPPRGVQHGSHAFDPAQTPRTEWMEIFLKAEKIGYSERHVNPLAEGYLVREEVRMRLGLMGRVSTLRAVTQATLNRDYTVNAFHFSMMSGAVGFEASGQVESDRMIVHVGGRERRTKTSFPLIGPVMIGAGLPGFFAGRRMEVGHSYSFLLFDPSTMAQREAVIRVTAREALELQGIRYDAFRLEGEFWGQDMRFWVDHDGGVLKEEGLMGLTLIRSGEARAKRDIPGRGEEDLSLLAAVPVEKKLWRPEKLTFLTLRVGGLKGIPLTGLDLNAGRQTLDGDILRITRERLSETPGYRAPYEGGGQDLADLLKPELGVESDDPFIVEAARNIAGRLQDPVALSRKIMGWVYGRVDKKPVMTVPSAAAVLESKVGDCNEHAVLLAALLRAAGIPARLCVGLVYKDGRFYYHAWNEAYVGSWVTMDATLNQMPADATHIRLVEGGLDKQARIIGVIGKLRLEVVDYGYD